MTKDSVSKLVNKLVKEHKFKFSKKEKESLEIYAYKVMNNPNTYPDEEDKDKCKRHAVYTMMLITARGKEK